MQLHHSTTLPALSTLKTFTNQNPLEISSPENLEIHTQIENNYVEDIKHDILSIDLNKMIGNSNNTNKVISNICKTTSKKVRSKAKRDIKHDAAEPLAFIKVEDEDNADDHHEGYYVDENLDDVRYDDDDDDKDFMVSKYVIKCMMVSNCKRHE